MNPILSLFTAGALYTAPVQQFPETYYVANLSENDGAKCGQYLVVYPQQQPIAQQIIIQQPITQSIIIQDNDDDE
jgi:hypothetical protein